ncbi:MAG: PIG-L family deacetylase [Spirochaetales bacterium]|nr:PIG-L family deacetylase [Spirochaetales bacterium]
MKKNIRETTPSKVENFWLTTSKRKLIYPDYEYIPVIEVDNYPSLGKMTAQRFLEWVLENPDGVISLPTGKTPEYFIKWVTHYLNNWEDKKVKQELEASGIEISKKPSLKNLHFVQMDEFFPINPEQRNSFYYYVNKFYIENFGLDRNKALFIDISTMGFIQGKTIGDIFPDQIVDLSLRTNQPKTNLERLQKEAIHQIDRWCMNYENSIRSLGGIGFFLGGIGPDGHIAFNVRGSSYYSVTRLTKTNYETQAAAASDLGGMEIARKRLVITIGLSTITFNPNVTALIFAAGEAKAGIVADAIQHPKDNVYPATILNNLKNARFYITKGAGCRLVAGQYENLKKSATLSSVQKDQYIIDYALGKDKRLEDIKIEELKTDPFTTVICEKYDGDPGTLLLNVKKGIIDKLNAGRMRITDKNFLHMAPHHDDIMLGYLPYIAHLVRPDSNKHTFAYATSGFTAVTNSYVLNLLTKLEQWLLTGEYKELQEEGYFQPHNKTGKDRDVHQYLDGVAARSQSMKDAGEARRLLRNLSILLEENNVTQISNRISEMKQYCSTQYPGKKDIGYIQELKGMMREWEADLMWAHFGFHSDSVKHLQLGFYKGDIFSEMPSKQHDVLRIYTLLEETNPDIVTVALDPEGSGPDTHYKVLQGISEALKMFEKKRPDIEVWGYRNVWYRFHPAEANIYVPVSLNSMAILEHTFENCFGSQREASFPSPELDGPFYKLSQKIMVEQYQSIKTCLGRDFFSFHESPRVRAAHGLVFLCRMTLPEFFQHTIDLKKFIEDRA